MRRAPTWREVAASYDQAASAYDVRHAEARAQARARLIDAPQLDAARGRSRVLELGCGTGRLLAQADARVRVGIDVSRGMLGYARARGLAVAVADAHRLPFADGCFDAILAGKGVWRYLDYERAFAECARVLAPGGALVVHQYAARTWSPRTLLTRVRLTRRSRAGSATPATPAPPAPPTPASPTPAPADELHVRHLDELRAPARRAGLRPERTYLWRSIRVPPYALRVPAWLPGHLWSHCVLVLRKPGTQAAPGAT